MHGDLEVDGLTRRILRECYEGLVFRREMYQQPFKTRAGSETFSTHKLTHARLERLDQFRGLIVIDLE